MTDDRLLPRAALDQIDVRIRQAVVGGVRKSVRTIGAVFLVLQFLVGVANGGRQILGDRRGHTNGRTHFLVVIVRIAAGLALEQVEAGGKTIAEEIRLGEREVVGTAVFQTTADGDADELATTEEVLFFDRGLQNEAVTADRVAGADAERAGRLVDHIDNHDDAIRSTARRGRDVDGREVAESLQTALGAADGLLVEGVAFGDVELATDDIVTRTGVAADLDALDIGALALVDQIGHADRVVLEIAVAARNDAGKRIAGSRNALGDRFHRLLDVPGTVGIAGASFEQALEFGRIDAFDGRTRQRRCRTCSARLHRR